MSVSQIMSFSATPPTTGETPATFNYNAIACWNELKTNVVPDLNTAFGEMNALETNVNAKEASAVSASAAAVASANFKGTWTNQLTTVGESWEYSGVIYGVLVAGTTPPITTPSNWFALTIAQAIKNIPAGNISATTVQAALNELDIKKGSSFRNRIINGDMAINQINGSTAATVTAGAALNYITDQWYAYCTGANVTTQRVEGSLQSQYRQQFTGATSVTKIGFAQRMEASFTYDMNGKSSMIGVDMSNSLLTSVTWTVWYANAADTFGTLATPTRTQIATGTITVSPTLERSFIPITIPSAATTGIEIEFSVAAQTSGTWVIGNTQFEKVPTGATTGTDFEVLPTDINMLRCQRYLPSISGSSIAGFSYSTTNTLIMVPFKVPSRIAPTGLILSSLSGLLISNGSASAGTPTSVAVDFAGVNSASIICVTTAGSPTLSIGQGSRLNVPSSSVLLFIGAQL